MQDLKRRERADQAAFTASPELLDRVRQQAASSERSFSAVVREALAAHLDREATTAA